MTILEVNLIGQIGTNLFRILFRNIVSWERFDQQVHVWVGLVLVLDQVLLKWSGALHLLLELLLLSHLKSYLWQEVEEISAHLEVNVAGDGRLVDMHHCSYLSHDKCSFFLEEFRLVKDLEDVVLFDHLLLLVFFLIFFYLLYKVSLSVLRGTQERYGLVVQVELV